MLRELVVNKNPPSCCELLHELRDISSMAMEHFDEHIVPTMKRNQLMNSAIGNNSSPLRLLRFRSNGTIDESSLSSTSSSSGSRPPESFALSHCGVTPTSNSGSNLKLEFVVQQHQMLINIHKRQILDLKTKVFTNS